MKGQWASHFTVSPAAARFAAALVLLSALALAGCSAPASTAPAAQPPAVTLTAVPATAVLAPATLPATQPAPTAAAIAAPTARPTPPPGTYVNPVLDRDFPDPDTLQVRDAYYAFATNGNGHNIQAARSTDLVAWEVLGDALPQLPEWAVQEFGWAWAPEVWQPAEGGPLVMYHVARFKIGEGGGTQCIGLATSDKPEGPFAPQDDKPLVCQVGGGGSIDPATFVDDDGKHYLLWKNDGNSGGGQTWIYIQPLSGDGLSLAGEPTRLLTADKAWEGVLVEAPTLWKHAGKYYLFYSANGFNTPRYATGYAVAADLLGPYAKPGGEPLLQTAVGAGIVGPGGQDIALDDEGDPWVLFHSWSAAGYRYMNLAPLQWADGKPEIAGLSREPQPIP